jgi:hypothetical protein
LIGKMRRPGIKRAKLSIADASRRVSHFKNSHSSGSSAERTFS